MRIEELGELERRKVALQTEVDSDRMLRTLRSTRLVRWCQASRAQIRLGWKRASNGAATASMRQWTHPLGCQPDRDRWPVD